jgi:hypothetical protein
MTKYQKYFQEMLLHYPRQFKQFKEIHDKYIIDPKKWSDQFNVEGEIILDIIREWERKLCSYSERGQYGVFSANLADKFWAQIRKYFPKIDFVGVKM